MGNRNSMMDARLQYEMAQKIVIAAGLDPKTVQLTQSTVRLEQALSISNTMYTFAVTNVDNGPAGTKFPSEIRLNQQDSLIVSEIGVYLGEAPSATSSQYADHTYPSPAVFSTANEASGLELIYKSQLKITVNNKVLIPSLQLGRFRLVPQSQQVAAAANQNGIANDQVNMTSDGIMINAPSIVLIGSSNNLVQVQIPSALPAVGTSTRLILEFRGLLAINSTIIT